MSRPARRGTATSPPASHSRPAGRGGRPPAGKAVDPRQVALDLLARIEGGAYANLVVPAALERSRLDRRSRALVTELVYGVTRMRRGCDWVVDQHLHRPVPDPAVRSALRLGAYQLVFTRMPPHAAVSTAVAVAPTRARSLVNAVLRQAAPHLPPRWPDAATELSYPDWVVQRLESDLGVKAARAALTQMNEAPAVTTRSDGYVQDMASQWVAALVGARTGERVADVCAGPGGKATALAEGRGGESPVLVVAGDLRPRRAALVAATSRRLGLAGVAAVVADGRRPPLLPGSLDRVLVDAPCTGLGALRRRPDARWRVGPDDEDRLAVLQAQLLAAAADLVRPGGTLVYSVCTLTARETRGIDAWLAGRHPELTPVPGPGDPWIPWGRGSLLLPQAAGTDGMYLLRLTRAPG